MADFIHTQCLYCAGPNNPDLPCYPYCSERCSDKALAKELRHPTRGFESEDNAMRGEPERRQERKR